MDVNKQLKSGVIPTLLPKQPYSLEDLKNELNAIIKNDGEPAGYVELYYKIPAHMKNLRHEFFERILQKARRKNWKIAKIADIASQIY